MYRTLYLTVYSHPYREYRTLYLTFYSHLYKEYRTLYLTFYSHPFKEYRTFTPIHIKSIELFPLQFTSRFNAKKVISEMYAFLYCSVLSPGGNVNTRRIWKPNMGSIFHVKNQLHILVIRKEILCELSKLSKFNAFNLLGYYTNTDASIFVCKFRPERTGFNMYAEYTRPQLTFLALVPWVGPLLFLKNNQNNCFRIYEVKFFCLKEVSEMLMLQL